VQYLHLEMLEDGSLPIYDVTNPGEYYCLHLETDAWQIKSTRSGRILIDVGIDLALTDLIRRLPKKLAQHTEDGSFILAFRSCSLFEFTGTGQPPDLTSQNCLVFTSPTVNSTGIQDVFVLAALAFVPGIEFGTPIENVNPTFLVEQACLGLAGQPYNADHPAVASCAQGVTERRIRRAAAQEKAIELLRQSLTERQLAEFEAHEKFHVVGADGHTYRIENFGSQNVYRIEDGKDVTKYCLITNTWVPTYDLMLVQKLLLETCPEEFHAKANVISIRDNVHEQIFDIGQRWLQDLSQI